MKLPVFIARRYLFSKKKQNAINIISLISVIGIAIGTTALIVVLSVFNGINSLVTSATEAFTPQIRVSPVQGKFISTDSVLLHRFSQIEDIRYYEPVIEENTLVKFRDQLIPVRLKGVLPGYEYHNGIYQTLTNGRFTFSVDSFPTAVVGYNIAAHLRLRLGTINPLTFYYPTRSRNASSTALNIQKIYPIGIFSAQQDIDSRYIITSLASAQRLFDVPGLITHYELIVSDTDLIPRVKRQLASIVGPNYRVTDRYSDNQAFYSMMHSEKLAVFIILLFILLIASFNIIGSVSMLIIDKKKDIAVYQALGMPTRRVISIFRNEGNLITGIGAAIGLFLGTTFCLLQQHFGFITLGEGSYIISAYPIRVLPLDIIATLAVVLGIGALASYFPVKFLIHRIVKL